eukprot:6185939-Pleurochrysis_carterae.AAC.2
MDGWTSAVHVASQAANETEGAQASNMPIDASAVCATWREWHPSERSDGNPQCTGNYRPLCMTTRFHKPGQAVQGGVATCFSDVALMY